VPRRTVRGGAEAGALAFGGTQLPVKAIACQEVRSVRWNRPATRVAFPRAPARPLLYSDPSCGTRRGAQFVLASRASSSRPRFRSHEARLLVFSVRQQFSRHWRASISGNLAKRSVEPPRLRGQGGRTVLVIHQHRWEGRFLAAERERKADRKAIDSFLDGDDDLCRAYGEGNGIKIAKARVGMLHVTPCSTRTLGVFWRRFGGIWRSDSLRSLQVLDRYGAHRPVILAVSIYRAVCGWYAVGHHSRYIFIEVLPGIRRPAG